MEKSELIEQLGIRYEEIRRYIDKANVEIEQFKPKKRFTSINPFRIVGDILAVSLETILDTNQKKSKAYSSFRRAVEELHKKDISLNELLFCLEEDDPLYVQNEKGDLRRIYDDCCRRVEVRGYHGRDTRVWYEGKDILEKSVRESIKGDGLVEITVELARGCRKCGYTRRVRAIHLFPDIPKEEAGDIGAELYEKRTFPNKLKPTCYIDHKGAPVLLKQIIDNPIQKVSLSNLDRIVEERKRLAREISRGSKERRYAAMQAIAENINKYSGAVRLPSMTNEEMIKKLIKIADGKGKYRSASDQLEAMKAIVESAHQEGINHLLSFKKIGVVSGGYNLLFGDYPESTAEYLEVPGRLGRKIKKNNRDYLEVHELVKKSGKARFDSYDAMVMRMMKH